MKVAAVLHGYPSDYLNGASLVSKDLLTTLAKRGHEVNVYSMLHNQGSSMVDGVNLYTYNPRDLPKADIVYTHPDLGNYGIKVSVKNKIPIVGYVHNYLFSTIRSIEDYRGRYARLYFNSEFTKKEVGFGGIVVRPPFKSVDYRIKVTGDKITLMNLWEGKGSTTFWKLALLMNYANFLGVKGYGYQSIRDGVPNVEIRNTVIHEKIKTVFKDTKIILVPSEQEAWGRVGIEAMCSGIPVLTTGVGGIREALGDAAIYIGANDLNGWKNELDKLINDPAYYNEWSEKCKEHVRVMEKEVQNDLNTFVEDIEQICNRS